MSVFWYCDFFSYLGQKNKYMKTLVTTLFLCLGFITNAQYHRFVYEYEFTTDSTQTDKMTKTLTNLDVHKNHSVFYSQDTYQRDSLAAESVIKQRKISPGNISISYEEVKFPEVVTKQYPNYNTQWQTVIESEALLVEEPQKFNWKLHPETEVIEGYKCQKATMNHQGKEWTAWFTNEIPLPEGPYKFSGLSGLIVKMHDAQNTHRFTLKGNEKLDDKNLPWEKLLKLKEEARFFIKPLKINRQQFKKLYKEYANDPVKQLKQELAMPNYSMTLKVDEKIITDNNEIIRYYEKTEREKLAKFNNPLEPNLYK